MKTIKSIIIIGFLTTFCVSAFAKEKKGKLTVAKSNFSNKVNNAIFIESTFLINLHEYNVQKAANEKEINEIRFFNNDKYRILSNTGLIIYSKTSLVQQGKGPKPTELFYFSAGITETILPLTLANLESVYGKNQKFTYAVESLFRSDSELAAYDVYNKQYKLAYLYLQNSK